LESCIAYSNLLSHPLSPCKRRLLLSLLLNSKNCWQGRLLPSSLLWWGDSRRGQPIDLPCFYACCSHQLHSIACVEALLSRNVDLNSVFRRTTIRDNEGSNQGRRMCCDSFLFCLDFPLFCLIYSDVRFGKLFCLQFVRPPMITFYPIRTAGSFDWLFKGSSSLSILPSFVLL